MTRNVVILTNFRTGSTSFTLKKSEEYRLPYKGELFSHERPHPIGKLPAKQTIVAQYGYSSYAWVDTYLSRWNLFQELQAGNQACYKMEVRHSGSFDKTGFITNNSDEAIRQPQLHLGTLGDGETYQNTIDPNDPIFVSSRTNVETRHLVTQIDRNYQAMGLMYKKVPGVLVCYEDYFSGDLYKPYNREIKWTSEPQIDEWVTDWTIENYFK